MRECRFNGDTFLDGADVGGLATAPGSDVMPGGLNDCIPIGVLEGEVGYDWEVGDLSVLYVRVSKKGEVHSLL